MARAGACNSDVISSQNLGKHFSSLALPDPILKNREGVRGQTQNYTEV